jgi:tetratricopeptide (TPR) repeat protein
MTELTKTTNGLSMGCSPRPPGAAALLTVRRRFRRSVHHIALARNERRRALRRPTAPLQHRSAPAAGSARRNPGVQYSPNRSYDRPAQPEDFVTQPPNTLTIRFSPAGADAYRLDLAGPRVGEVSGAFTPPFDSATWPAIWRGLEPGADISPADRHMLLPLGDPACLPETAGRALAVALLADAPVASAFATALSVASAERRPLLVELRFAGGTDAVAALPWELLHHQDRFLVADTSIALTRYPEGALPPTEALAELPLRVLLALAEPVDAAPILSHEARAELMHGLRSLDEAGAVIVDLLRPPTFATLVEAVRNGGYHLLVFYGHGALDGLLFEDEYGGGTMVQASELGAALRNTEVRLALLATGQSAQPGASIWSAVAPALVQAGVPLAIGLQTSLPVDAALAFIRQFALSLAAGKPVVEAVADGRLPLTRAGAAWFVPALYGRPRTDTRLFDLGQALPAETAALRGEMRAVRAEIAQLERSAPQEIAALRAARQRFVDARAALAERTPGGYAAITSPLYGVPTNPIFVGRSAELQRVSRALRGTQPVVIWGTGGIGKTALATEVSHRQRWRFPGGVLWLNCSRPWESLLDRMGGFCGLDMQHVEPAKKDSTVRWALAGLAEGCLLVWDNAEAVWDSQLVRDFVAQLPASCRALITTREDPDQPMWTVVEVTPLPDAAMAELFHRLADAAGVRARSPADLAAIPLILGRLQGHPQALELVVPQARRRGLAQVWQDLQKRPLKGVEAALEASYQRLSELQKRLFARLSVWTIPFGWPAAEALLPNTRDLDDALDTLVQRALIGFDGARYSYHPLVHQVAYEKLRAFEEPRRVHRLAAVWLRGKLDDDGGAPEEALEEVDQWERAEAWELFALSAITLVRSVAPQGYWPDIEARLARAQQAVMRYLPDQPMLEAHVLSGLAGIAHNKGLWDDAILLLTRAEGQYRTGGSLSGLADSLGNLGLAYHAKGEWDKAIEYHRGSLQIAEQLGDVPGVARTYNNLGSVCVNKGEWNRAIEFFKQSSRTMEEIGDFHGLASVYNNLGIVYTRKGEWDKAIDLFQQSLRFSERVGDVYVIAKTHANLGIVYTDKSEWNRAIEYYSQSLQTSERFGDIHGVASIQVSLGNVYKEIGEWDRAIEYYSQSLQTNERFRDLHGMAMAYGGLGLVFERKGEWDKAIEFHQRSLEIAEQIGDVHGMAKCYNNLGLAYHRKRDWDQAIVLWQRSLQSLKQLGDLNGIAMVYNNLGMVHSDRGELEQAMEFYRQSLEISERLGDSSGMALTYGNLGVVYAGKGEGEQATRLYQQSLELNEKIGMVDGMAYATVNLGSADYRTGDWDRAIDLYQQSLQILERLGDSHSMAETYRNLGEAYAKKGEWDQAIRFYHQSLEISDRMGDARSVRGTCGNLGDVYYDMAEWDRSLEFYQQSLHNSQGIGDVQRMAATYGRMGDLYYFKKDWDKAIECYQQCFQIEEQAGDISGMAKTYNNLGLVYAGKGEWDKAVEVYGQSLRIDQQVGDIHGMAKSLGNLGSLFGRQGDAERAAYFASRAYLMFADLEATADVAQAGALLVEILGSAEAANAYLASVADGAVGQPDAAQAVEDQYITLEQLLDDVVEAQRGDQALLQMLTSLTRDMASDPIHPAEARALGRVLQSVLAGDRAPDLSDLPPGLADAVQAMLARLQPST